jgi:hypothetical protein
VENTSPSDAHAAQAKFRSRAAHVQLTRGCTFQTNRTFILEKKLRLGRGLVRDLPNNNNSSVAGNGDLALFPEFERELPRYLSQP